jgi:hypothetical protein
MEIDVRQTAQAVVDIIRFADDDDTKTGNIYASVLIESSSYPGTVEIMDKTSDYLLIRDAEMARDLIKALDKAVKLGWLK